MSEKSPWWQTTKTVQQGLWQGCGFAVVGLSELLFGLLVGRGHAWDVVVGAGFLAVGLTYLTSAVALRKRQRSGSAQDGHPTMRDSTPPTF